MKNLFLNITGLLAISLVSTNVLAAGPFEHSGQASKKSVQAIGHSSAAGAKLASGAVAIPLTIASEVGVASGETANALRKNDNQSVGEPLEITDEIITAGPSPEEVIRLKEKAQ
jgi:hypothetical protein